MVKHMTKERAQQHLDSIMDNFDFRNVHKAMRALDWVWASNDMEVPEPYHLREQVRRLFWDCFSNKEQSLITTACGGFWVSLDKEQDYADCKFAVSTWESEGEDFENE